VAHKILLGKIQFLVLLLLLVAAKDMMDIQILRQGLGGLEVEVVRFITYQNPQGQEYQDKVMRVALILMTTMALVVAGLVLSGLTAPLL
jgi:hypothetical protein